MGGGVDYENDFVLNCIYCCMDVQFCYLILSQRKGIRSDAYAITDVCHYRCMPRLIVKYIESSYDK